MDPAHLLTRWFRSTDACLAIGDWLRRFHNAQNGFEPDPSMPWRRCAVARSARLDAAWVR